MTYLLDTNTCVAYLNGRSRRVIEAFERRAPADIAVCSIVKAELHYGALRSRNPPDSLAKPGVFLAPYRSLAFDDPCAAAYGRIRARLAEFPLKSSPPPSRRARWDGTKLLSWCRSAPQPERPFR